MFKFAPLFLFASAVLAGPARKSCPVADVSILAHDGIPVGYEKVYDGRQSIQKLDRSDPWLTSAYLVNFYISEPKGKKHDTVILLLTDVLGIQYLKNKLSVFRIWVGFILNYLTQCRIIDSFARAGYLTVAPDMFEGKPAPADYDVPEENFKVLDFVNAHGPEVTDPKMTKAMGFIKDKLKVKTVATVGYCFGGRYAFRLAAPGKGSSAVYAAHPTLLMDDDIAANSAPASIAAPDRDYLTSAERYQRIQEGLTQTGVSYELAMYGGTYHGFGVHPNMSDPKQVYGKEQAFFQAVRWLDNWA
jgi:dienelactone hydrolase